MSYYTIKANRLSAEGVARGLPAVISHGTWNADYAMYGGDILSKDGRVIFYQITETAMHLAIGSYTALYTYVSGGKLYVKSVKGTTLSAAKEIDTPVSTGTTGHQLLWVKSYNSSGTNYDLYYVFDINSTGYANTRVIVNATTGAITLDLGQDTTAGTAVVFHRPILLAADSGRCTAVRTQLGANYDLLSLSSSGAQISSAVSTIAKVGDLWFVSSALWFQNNSDDHVKIQFTVDSGANYTEVSGGDGSTDYSLVAVDGTYLYATKAGETIIYKGTLSNGNVNVDWVAFFDYTGYTLNGMDADTLGHFIVGLTDGATKSWLVTIDNIVDLTATSLKITRSINTSPNTAVLKLNSSIDLTADLIHLKIYDKDSILRFEGYPLPSEGDFIVRCEGIDRILKSPVNAAYSAQTLHDIAADIETEGLVEPGTNELDDSDTYSQVWGASMPRDMALSTLTIAGAGYWRTKVTAIDCFDRTSIANASGKTITFGTTSVALISKRNAVTKPINQLVVYGACASSGRLQLTEDDALDQLSKGIVTQHIKRTDIQSYDMLLAFKNELWALRSSTNTIPKVFTLKVWGRTWLDAGDTVIIANGTSIDEELIDGTYFILSAEIDLVLGEKMIEISTSYVSQLRDYSDSLPVTAQLPVMGADSASGNTIVQTDFTTLLGSKWNDLIIPMASGKLPASNYPDWASFTANTSAYKFAINEYLDLTPVEFVHGWVEGSTIKPHLHIVLSAATAQEEKVQFTLYYSWGDVNEVMAAETSVSGEYTVPNGTADKTHLLVPLTDIAGTNFKIGSIFNCRIKRVAKSAGGNELTAEPFVLSFGIHIEEDALGSKEVSVK